ncbi:hypothetical protein LA6_001180 [Marinibacterium anthonyi]|nr:hypothetical protein LA6_001180 [Marinibacterium anthonyi]
MTVQTYMPRRAVLKALPTAGCAIALPSILPSEPAAPEFPTDMPFLAEIKARPGSYLNPEGLFALCYPKSEIDHAYCYMLADQTTIFAEGKRWRDGRDGSGWQPIEPGQFDGRVIGRVVGVHIKQHDGWHQCGSAYIAG